MYCDKCKAARPPCVCHKPEPRQVPREAPGYVPIEEYEKLHDALTKIKQWGEAYPESVFPEPDFKNVAKVLKDNGLVLDQISASNIRHVVKGVAEIAAKALST